MFLSFWEGPRQQCQKIYLHNSLNRLISEVFNISRTKQVLENPEWKTFQRDVKFQNGSGEVWGRTCLRIWRGSTPGSGDLCPVPATPSAGAAESRNSPPSRGRESRDSLLLPDTTRSVPLIRGLPASNKAHHTAPANSVQWALPGPLAPPGGAALRH